MSMIDCDKMPQLAGISVLKKRFMERVKEYADLYNPKELMKKLGKVAKQAGATTVYHVLLLYYALGNPEIPLNKRLIVMGALGYFILPVDFIPDFLIGGLIDDGSIILFALKQIASFITKEIKEKARRKLHEWFGDCKFVDVTDVWCPGAPEADPAVAAMTEEEARADKIIDNFLNFKGMELFATYEELNAYIAEKVKKPITLGFAEGGDLKVCYTQRVLIKNVTVPVTLHFEEVQADSVLVEYKGSFGLDALISTALDFIMKRLPEYSAGIIPEEGHRIRVDLTKIKKAEPLVQNVALRAITPAADGIRIAFALKA